MTARAVQHDDSLTIARAQRTGPQSVHIGVPDAVVDAGTIEHVALGGETEDRMVVTVRLHQC